MKGHSSTHNPLPLQNTSDGHTTMKTFIWILIILAAGAYFVNTSLDNKASRETERAEEQGIKDTIHVAIGEMVARTNATDNWERQLVKEDDIRFEPVLTIELEKLWLNDRPILFLGTIKDISTYDETHYTVLIERNATYSSKFTLITELQLSLHCEKQIIDEFLEEHPNLFKEFHLENSVAVAANIKSIRTHYIPSEGISSEEIKTGEGDLVEILYIGDVFF